jgi:hypothetical protein
MHSFIPAHLDALDRLRRTAHALAMELFQLRVESGGGRAFTPSRGSMVVLTHVALVVEPNSGGDKKKEHERVTVLVSSGGTPAVALGTVSDAPGMEQFSIGGSGLCFGDEKRVEVRHTGSSGTCVCLTGRIEETYEGELTSSDEEDYDDDDSEGDSEDDDDDSDDDDEDDDDDSEDSDGESDSEESEEDADVMETVERYAARAAAARKAMDEDESDDDDEDEDEDDESSEDDDDDDDSEDDSSSSDSDDESDSDESDDSDALPGSKRKGVSSEQARRESKFEDAREAKRSKGNFGRSKSFRRK